MAENSGIEWTTHTFNPWIGCTKVSAACDHCYAEAWDMRFTQGARWGAKADRTRTARGNWSKPRTWNHKAGESGIRERVFCASLADVFDNHKSIQQEWRDDLYQLIRDTPHLDWLLLTKRPQNMKRFLPDDWGNGYANVWLGTTAENQTEYDRRKPHLVSVPAVVHYLSMEPLIGPVDMGDMSDLEWIITGGESGNEFRPADHNWFRSLRDQSAARNVPFLFKQFEGKNQKQIKAMGRALDGVVHDGYPLVDIAA